MANLGLKLHSFKCRDDNEYKNILKVISKSQWNFNKFEEFKEGLDGEDYQRECDNYVLKSIIPEMYLHKIKESSLSFFDNKRNFLIIKESLPWN